MGFIQTPLKKAGGIDRVENAVNTLLEAGPTAPAAEGGIIAPWRSARNMAKRLDIMQDVTGAKIGQTLKALDDQGIQVIDPMEILANIKKSPVQSLGKSIEDVAKDSPEVAKKLETITNLLEDRATEVEVSDRGHQDGSAVINGGA